MIVRASLRMDGPPFGANVCANPAAYKPVIASSAACITDLLTYVCNLPVTHEDASGMSVDGVFDPSSAKELAGLNVMLAACANSLQANGMSQSAATKVVQDMLDMIPCDATAVPLPTTGSVAQGG
ncbi:MAG TPA: hypothetical protein VGI39_40875 [Polyangiaceae bacterium]